MFDSTLLLQWYTIPTFFLVTYVLILALSLPTQQHHPQNKARQQQYWVPSLGLDARVYGTVKSQHFCQSVKQSLHKHTRMHVVWTLDAGCACALRCVVCHYISTSTFPWVVLACCPRVQGSTRLLALLSPRRSHQSPPSRGLTSRKSQTAHRCSPLHTLHKHSKHTMYNTIHYTQTAHQRRGWLRSEAKKKKKIECSKLQSLLAWSAKLTRRGQPRTRVLQ